MTDGDRVYHILRWVGFRPVSDSETWYFRPDGSICLWDDLPNLLDNISHWQKWVFPHLDDWTISAVWKDELGARVKTDQVHAWVEKDGREATATSTFICRALLLTVSRLSGADGEQDNEMPEVRQQSQG